MCSAALSAQEHNVVMTIDGEPIARSIFIDAYKQNYPNGVSSKKELYHFAERYAEYYLKHKVAAQQQQGITIDNRNKKTVSSAPIVKNNVAVSADIEQQARNIYNKIASEVSSKGGLVKLQDIHIYLSQRASKEDEKNAKDQIEAIYNKVKAGEDFGKLAQLYTQNTLYRATKGELPWLAKGQTLSEFENVAFALSPGEVSKPFMSVDGYHLLYLQKKVDFLPYNEVRANIIDFILKDKVRQGVDMQHVFASGEMGNNSSLTAISTTDDVLNTSSASSNYGAWGASSSSNEQLLAYLNSNVWNGAEAHSGALERYFEANKKKYRFDEPRFKGYVLYAKSAELLKELEKKAKHAPLLNLNKAAIENAVGGSKESFKIDEGIFSLGENTVVDKEFYKQHNTNSGASEFPFTKIVGKKVKQPDLKSEVAWQVLADYKEYLEQQWLAKLKKSHSIVINKKELSTIN